MTAPRNYKEELNSMAIAVGGIWSAVVVISLFSPDMVSGSEQQHMPVAAFSTWIWGVVSTYAVFTGWARMRRVPGEVELHRPLAMAVAALWLTAAAVAVFTPEVVTGSDPTRLPLAAMLAPIAAMVLTLLARGAAEYVGKVLSDDTVVTHPGSS